jgi:hypothetical protein
MPTSQSPQFSPSGLNLRMGLVQILHHILITQTELWSFFKLSASYLSVHMKLSLHMSFLSQTQPRGLHGGHHHRIPSQDRGGFSPIISPSNLTEVPTVPYENWFHPPSSDRFWAAARHWALGLLSE